jgi:hypothetical protein
MESASGLTLTAEEWRVLACVLAENEERGDTDILQTLFGRVTVHL